MGKKSEVINNTDIDDENSIQSDDDNVMDNLKDLVSNLTKKGKKNKSKKEEEIVIDVEDDSEEDDSEEDDSEEDDSEDDDSEDDGDEESSANDGIAFIAPLLQDSLYDSNGVSVGESLSKIANLMEKFYNLEKKKYQKNKE